MRQRSKKQELIDLGPEHYTDQEYGDCLAKMERINKLFGGHSATLNTLATLPTSPNSILDVGCGNGAFTLTMALKYPHAHVVGTDISPDAIAHAYAYKTAYEDARKQKISNLVFEHRTQPHLSEAPQSFDVITSTLVWHHLTDQAIIDFLKSGQQIARKAIIINDLHRHHLAYAAFWCIAPFFRNRLIAHDGLLSIKRSFKHSDLVSYLHAAQIPPEHWSISWKWAFRWIIKIVH